MKLSSKVKAGEETKTGGSNVHAKGRYIFQFQEGVDFKVGEKEEGNSYTYFFPMKSVDTAGSNADADAVGGNFNEWVNVMYHGDELNKGGFDYFSALMIHSGMLGADDDVDITSQQFADRLKLKLVDKLVGIEIGHRKETVKKMKDDSGDLVELAIKDQYQVDRAFALKVFPVSGGNKASSAPAQQMDADW